MLLLLLLLLRSRWLVTYQQAGVVLPTDTFYLFVTFRFTLFVWLHSFPETYTDMHTRTYPLCSPPQKKPKHPFGFLADAAGVEEESVAVAFVSTPS